MTLYETIDLLKKIALKHPNIGSASEGNIYEYMNANPSVKYGVFFITQGTHSQDEMFNHFEFTLFYVDRLVDDMEENRLQIQSIGKEILSNILTFFCEEFDAECENISFQPFTQKFVDMTAGIYSTITIDVPKDVICPEEYWKEDWVAPVTVIRNQDKRVVFTENGTYTIDYDPTTYTGLGNVEVNVNIDVDSYYNNGYNQGKTDGIDEQKGKLESISITENGTYTKEDGYNEIVVDVPDLNGSYDEGKTDGVNEQKSKLERIEITENGTYSREDGYNEVVVNVPDLNGDYNEGYEQGQADVAANAIDLVATEFGTYYTKYSNNIVYPEVTGVFPNGENFYNYAYTDKIYDTGIAPNANSEIELWFKPDDTGGTWGCIISAGHLDNDKYSIRIRRVAYDAIYIANFGEGKGNDVKFNLNTDIFNHIKLSANGLYVNGVLYDGFEPGNFTPQDTFVIDGFNGPWAEGETGYYGMVKITTDGVENVIIPTEDGFKNTTTNTILPQIKENIGSKYNYINNSPIILDNLIKSVDVVTKVNVQKAGLKFGHSAFKEVPEWADFEGITDMSYMFSDCNNLQRMPQIDASNVNSMDNTFYFCTNLQTIPSLNTSNVTNMANMFYSCYKLQAIPSLDTSKVTNMNNTFANCDSLTSLPALNAQSLNVPSYMGVFGYNDLPKITDFGGFLNLKCSLTNDNNLKRLPNLTYESCINLLNGLYDFTGNGETPNSNQGQLKVAQSFIDKVGDEISIGTAKGWVISA